MDLRNYFVCFACLLVAEHVGRRNNLPWLRTSTWMRRAYAVLSPYAAWFGILCADVIGFLAFVDMHEWVQTVREFAESADNLVFGLGCIWGEGLYRRVLQTSSIPVYIISVVLLVAIVFFVQFPYSIYLVAGMVAAGVLNYWWNINHFPEPPPLPPVVAPASPPPLTKRSRARVQDRIV